MLSLSNQSPNSLLTLSFCLLFVVASCAGQHNAKEAEAVQKRDFHIDIAPSSTSLRLTTKTLTTQVPALTLCPLTAPILTYSHTPNNVTVAPVHNATCKTALLSASIPACNTAILLGAGYAIISECTQSITFSVDKEFAFSSHSSEATATSKPRFLGLFARKAKATTTTSNVGIVNATYYVASWQDLATGVPRTVTVKTCQSTGLPSSGDDLTRRDDGDEKDDKDGGDDHDDDGDCQTAIEEWTVTTTSYVGHRVAELQVSTDIAGPIEIIYDSNSTAKIPASSTTPFALNTSVTFSSTVTIPTVVTSVVSRIAPNSTLTKTITVSLVGNFTTTTTPKTTITRTHPDPTSASSSKEPTTTVTSFSTSTTTVTVIPQPVTVTPSHEDFTGGEGSEPGRGEGGGGRGAGGPGGHGGPKARVRRKAVAQGLDLSMLEKALLAL
ncbi:hypothetical protein L228DRAFT_250108 [Xylona heveae TC161]|uniref:Uncharacterized protein n=1 Tax=Xylona heveae (strain CBS 132557 / TC161) TaxID=1328760 RepID=A0A165AG66_XYLHT|nr:hypothetical protein L228DRAFT_250108 [Xylona heveae TC161]KZF20422.1 hypothetical protein L228DRAFT_250108 [Xylona heveae TC161]